MRKALLVVGLVLLILLAARVIERRAPDQGPLQLQRIARETGWKAGDSVAEIGAGRGALAALAAELVGPGGRVYATEIDDARLAEIQALITDRRLHQLVATRGHEEDSGLPNDCCRAIFMRWVYHHFKDTAAMNLSLYRALRADGRLAIADFAPTPTNRVLSLMRIRTPDGQHRDVIIREVTNAGFIFDRDLAAWPGFGYCLIFRKPVHAAQ